MKTTRCFALAATLAALAAITGCQTASDKTAGDIVVTISSETPMGYAGTVVIDGQRQNVSGVTPAVLNYRGHRADCEIRKTSGTGTLKVDVTVGGRTVTLNDSGAKP